jgi:glutaredoxin
MKLRALIAVFVVTAAFAASAQQLYRWTDETGRVHITDTPPPSSARNVQQKKSGAVGGGAESQQPYELAQATRDFPVTLYTSPNCNEPCALARGLLNKRAVPFKEVQVWDEKSNEELKRVSGGDDVPTLVVGRSVHRGYAEAGYDALLDAARYPRAGLLPSREQAAPAPPGGYNAAPEAPKPAAEAPAPRGPYAPKAPQN